MPTPDPRATMIEALALQDQGRAAMSELMPELEALYERREIATKRDGQLALIAVAHVIAEHYMQLAEIAEINAPPDPDPAP